jgi:hypothetical protein
LHKLSVFNPEIAMMSSRFTLLELPKRILLEISNEMPSSLKGAGKCLTAFVGDIKLCLVAVRGLRSWTAPERGVKGNYSSSMDACP